MNKYNPLKATEPEEWLACDESERMALINRFHLDSCADVPEGAENMHATVHLIVENQLAEGFESVSAAISKLVFQGMDRHEAIHAVGAVLSEEMFELYRGSNAQWDQNKYDKRLDKLSAMRWRKGKW
ncbi:MAG: hypothetical protein IMF09_04310 [Proteobacteria bacterium]|nr:hypothetical protein [Pseudomonadota bacterium]